MVVEVLVDFKEQQSPCWSSESSNSENQSSLGFAAPLRRPTTIRKRKRKTKVKFPSISHVKKQKKALLPPGNLIYCHSCGTTDTPTWRRGPDGYLSLCNACGIHYAKNVQREKCLAPVHNVKEVMSIKFLVDWKKERKKERKRVLSLSVYSAPISEEQWTNLNELKAVMEGSNMEGRKEGRKCVCLRELFVFLFFFILFFFVFFFYLSLTDELERRRRKGWLPKESKLNG